MSAAPAPEAIAVAVVFDTSGSMSASIRPEPGAAPVSKLIIARRAFHRVIDRLEAFAKTPDAKPLLVGVYIFRGSDAVAAVPLSRFDPAALRTWLDRVSVGGSTPLGAAIALAGRDALAASAASRHILVLTDGENTAGPRPEAALAQLSTMSTAKQIALFTHVIALDLRPDVFSALKKQGATLIGATNETELNQQFDFILEEKILVEAPRAAAR